MSIYIEDNSPKGDTLWPRIDAALNDGYVVFFRSPLLRRLTAVIGREFDGKRWLVLKPHSSQSRARYILSLCRLRDFILSGVVLVLLSPLLVIVTLLVKLSSPGPILYSTVVVGEAFRRFEWFKFRSMIVVPETQDVEQRREQFIAYVNGKQASGAPNAPVKTIDRNRLTKIGAFIRRYSIDELPQLWNVLRGEMSLVGPRPCLPYELEFYNGWRKRRFEVKQGMTGVWQVFGRGHASFDEAVAMDVFYIYRRSFGFDLYLLIKTISVVLTGRGAM